MLGDRLAYLRKNRKERQEDVAQKLGIARGTYGMYEQGHREPDLKTIQALADYYDVSVDYLLGRNQIVQNQKIDLNKVLDDMNSDITIICDEGILTEEEFAIAISTIRSFRKIMIKKKNSNHGKLNP